MTELVSLTIDGKLIQAAKGATVWQAAQEAGIFIPIYCYHPKMPPLGACRICMIELENPKLPKPMAACTTTVSEGMIVHTMSDPARKARQAVMEFLLINHPLDCPICDKGGECDLQNYAIDYGRGVGRFQEEKRHLGKAIELGPMIALDRERCIMCQRCVRFCNEIVQDEGLLIDQRGARAQIATQHDQPYISQFSGNTVEMCPVGALTARTYRFKARPWELRHTPSVCPHCPVGCNIEIDNRLGREVVRFMSRTNDAVDDGWLCDRGRYGHGFIHSQERLRSPLLRKGNRLEPVTWQEAFEYLVTKIRSIRTENGLQALGAMVGTHATNEEIYTFQKFARTVLNTNNVAFRSGSFAPYKLADVPQLTSATIAGMEKAKVIVLIGANVSERQPVLELRLKKARNKGAKLVFVGGNPGPLTRFAAVNIECAPEAIPQVLQGIAGGLSGLQIPPTVGADVEKVAALLKDADSQVWLDELATLAPGCNQLFGDAVKLVEAAGQKGKAGLGLGILTTANNSTGARDIAGIESFEAGLSYGDMLSSNNNLKALFVMGANPLADIELFGGNAGALTKLDLLVVSEMFLTPTAELAHVVLPAASFAEKEGTFTNVEGRVQRILASLPPMNGTAPEIAIWLELANRLGQPIVRQSVAEIFDELSQVLPAYNGLSYATLGDKGQVRPFVAPTATVAETAGGAI